MGYFFISVNVVYGFETCNRMIAGSTMSKQEQAVRSSSANECPAGLSPRESATGTIKIPTLVVGFLWFWGA